MTDQQETIADLFLAGWSAKSLAARFRRPHEQTGEVLRVDRNGNAAPGNPGRSRRCYVSSSIERKSGHGWHGRTNDEHLLALRHRTREAC